MVLISFEHLQRLLIFPKFQGCNSKIVPATPFWILKFKWAWQTQFLSHNLVTLKNYVFFKDLQMILVPFFHIPTGFQLRKNGFKSSVHILRCPWSRVGFALSKWSHLHRAYLVTECNQSFIAVSYLSCAIKTNVKTLALTLSCITKGQTLHINWGRSHLWTNAAWNWKGMQMTPITISLTARFAIRILFTFLRDLVVVTIHNTETLP